MASNSPRTSEENEQSVCIRDGNHPSALYNTIAILGGRQLITRDSAASALKEEEGICDVARQEDVLTGDST